MCSGTNRLQLAPGFYRCTSTVIDRTGGPGLTNPRLGPPVIDTARECGFEYQEGGAGVTEYCGCGTLIVGRCAECSKPVCGVHSGMHAGKRRLCGSCWRAADEAAEARARALSRSGSALSRARGAEATS
jgi:hypothetical protein